MNQNNVFYKSEGDQWFKRNEAVLLFRNQNYDWPIKLIRKHKIKPQKVLEIGAANGWRLAEIKKLYGRTRCVGVEPSAKAVWAGRRNFPQIKMLRGLSSDLPVKGTFDLVIVNYVLHWVDRALLFKTFSEIDRVLADDGYLIVSDFYPSVATSNLYHHIRGGKVRTYKQNYAEVFTMSVIYKELEKVIFDHSTKQSKKISPSDETGFAVLLKKSLRNHYKTGKRK